MSKRVCFVGHRRAPFIKDSLRQAVLHEIKCGATLFTMGTHGDFDKIAFEVCVELKKIYKDVVIEVVLTSLSKAMKDNPYTMSGIKTVVYDIEDKHFKRQITESNRQMIDTCDTLICYVDEKRTKSGARYAYNYAKKRGLKIVNIYNENK